jgi:hypothetical protein
MSTQGPRSVVTLKPGQTYYHGGLGVRVVNTNLMTKIYVRLNETGLGLSVSYRKPAAYGRKVKP